MDKATSNLLDLLDLLTQQKEKGELLNLKFVLDIFNQVVEGLSALHDADIVNSNLRASNIMLFTQGGKITVKISDYEGFPGTSADYS